MPRHQLEHVLDTAEAAHRLRDRLRGTRRAGAAAAAAKSRSPARWAPGTTTSVRSNSACSRPSWRSRASLPWKNAPSPGSGSPETRTGSSRAARDCGPGEHGRVVGVDDRPVASRLVLEDARLRGGVRLERRVAVEVIRREVEPDRHLRVEAHDALELEARDLGHEDAPRRGSLDQADQRRADVAADAGVEARGAQHAACRGRGGGLALRAGDREQPPLQVAEGQLDLRDHGHAGAPRGLELRQLPRHARRDDDQLRRR